jgi:replicative DNA helicase
LDQLAPGTRLALPRVLPTATREATMQPEELALLGHMIGDGCALPRQPIHYTTNDPGVATLVAELATKVFGEAVAPRISPERSWIQVYLAAAQRLTHGKRNPVARWLDGMGVFGLRSFEKRIPDQVFAQPDDSIALFLRHLWATDGCIHFNPDSGHYASVYYASSSEVLARQVQSLLLRLGLNGTLSCQSQGAKGRDRFHVHVSGKDEILRFISVVGALGEQKCAHARLIVDEYEDKVPKTNRDVVPASVWRSMVRPAMAQVGMSDREFQASLGVQSCSSNLYKHNLGRERALRVANAASSDALMAPAQGDVYWDEIKTIELDGSSDVFDLTVDHLHNFVANDIILHNSIEQDADIVMFIYRDEYYNPDSDKKATAEVIVAKHRNGPVGQVDLYFEKNLTKFQSITSRPFNGPA